MALGALFVQNVIARNLGMIGQGMAATWTGMLTAAQYRGTGDMSALNVSPNPAQLTKAWCIRRLDNVHQSLPQPSARWSDLGVVRIS
jgi:hypothetical protein